MERPRSEDHLYTAVVLAFLGGLVALGILGLAPLLVAAIGLGVAALGIAFFHRALERRGRSSARAGGRVQVPERYVPRVLERGSMRRRRGVHLRRHRDASPPLRFR
jgi:hypothetical protein